MSPPADQARQAVSAPRSDPLRLQESQALLQGTTVVFRKFAFFVCLGYECRERLLAPQTQQETPCLCDRKDDRGHDEDDLADAENSGFTACPKRGLLPP